MQTRNYLFLCGAVTLAVVVSLLFIPGLSDRVEQIMLLFLSTNAR